jgi:hypothetical protein
MTTRRVCDNARFSFDREDREVPTDRESRELRLSRSYGTVPEAPDVASTLWCRPWMVNDPNAYTWYPPSDRAAFVACPSTGYDHVSTVIPPRLADRCAELFEGGLGRQVQ